MAAHVQEVEWKNKFVKEINEIPFYVEWKVMKYFSENQHKRDKLNHRMKYDSRGEVGVKLQIKSGISKYSGQRVELH